MNYETMLKSSFVFINKEAVQDIIDRLAREINDYYGEKEVVVIPLLYGGMMLASKLQEQFTFPYSLRYIHSQLYGEGNKDTGLVTIKNHTLPFNLEGKSVLLVEDIFASGKTLANIDTFVRRFWHDAGDIQSVVLLETNQERETSYKPNYVGKIISKDVFVFGFGMDFNENWRGLDHVRVMIN